MIRFRSFFHHFACNQRKCAFESKWGTAVFGEKVFWAFFNEFIYNFSLPSFPKNKNNYTQMYLTMLTDTFKYEYNSLKRKDQGQVIY